MKLDHGLIVLRYSFMVSASRDSRNYQPNGPNACADDHGLTTELPIQAGGGYLSSDGPHVFASSISLNISMLWPCSKAPSGLSPLPSTELPLLCSKIYTCAVSQERKH